LTWAFRNGSESPKNQEEILHFLMAKIFGFTPEQTDQMEYLTVLNMIYLETEWRKKETER
jgi:hypothetical protein